MRGGAAVDDEGNPAAEAGEDVGRAGRADSSAGVGGRRGQGPSSPRQQVAHRRVGRRTQSDRRQAGGDEGGDARILAERNHQGQRAWPVAFGERLGLRVEAADLPRLVQAGDVNDERVEARPSLGLVDSRHGFAMGRVGGEAVDRLGRHRHDLAGGDQGRGLGDCLGSVRQDACLLRAHRAGL